MLWMALTEDSLLAEFLGRLLQGRMFVHLKLSDAHADPARDIPEFVSDKLSHLGYTTAAVLLDAALFPAVRQGNRYAALRLLRKRAKSAVMTIAVITPDLLGDSAQAYDAGADIVLEGKFEATELIPFVRRCTERYLDAKREQKLEKLREWMLQLTIGAVCAAFGLLSPSIESCRDESAARAIAQSWYASFDTLATGPDSIKCEIRVHAIRNSFPAYAPVTVTLLPPRDLLKIRGIDENRSSIDLKGNGDAAALPFEISLVAGADELRRRSAQLRIELSGPGHPSGQESYKVYLPVNALIEQARNIHPPDHSSLDFLPGAGKAGLDPGHP